MALKKAARFLSIRPFRFPADWHQHGEIPLLTTYLPGRWITHVLQVSPFHSGETPLAISNPSWEAELEESAGENDDDLLLQT
jgi:hypothetical protein